MASLDDVEAATRFVARIVSKFGWIPWRATHIEKEAYSLLFLRPEGGANSTDAVRAIASVQNRVARTGWRHAPLVLVFPFKNYRLSTFVPDSTKVRGKRIERIRGVPVRSYAKADKAVAHVLARKITEETLHLIGTSVHESLAALAWYQAVKPEAMARNVELTVPTPYPDIIRYRSRMYRDYGVTIGEFDGIGVKRGHIRIMEAKAASGGPRKWEYIIRHKLISYSGAVPRLGKNVRADFVITSNSDLVAERSAQTTEMLVRNVPFVGDIYAAWVKDSIRWERV